MQDERQTCTAYVDYENLVDILSHHASLDSVTLLNHVLERARQQFRIQRILIFGNWTLYPMPDGIDTRGVVRCAYNDPGVDASIEIEESILQSLTGKESSQTYLLISGQARYEHALKRLHQAQKNCIVWTLQPLNEYERAWSSTYEQLHLPPNLERLRWPRQILLQALILEVARASKPESVSLTMTTLREALRERPTFTSNIDMLLSLSMRENLLLLQESFDPLQEPFISLNRRHQLSVQALLIQARILHTVHILQQSRGWVAFSTLDKALATFSLLANSQRLRHSWLEMLIEHGDLQSECRISPERQHTTTTLRLAPSVPMTRIAQEWEQTMLTLICVADIYVYRRRKEWISARQLCRYLTLHMTHTEARASVTRALEEKVLVSEVRPSKRNPEGSTNVLWLDREQLRVRDKLDRRDHLLLTAYTHLAQRNFRTSESVLIEEWCATEQLTEEEAQAWLRLLIQVGIIRKVPTETSTQSGEYIIYLLQDDPLIYTLRVNQERQHLEMEVQE